MKRQAKKAVKRPRTLVLLKYTLAPYNAQGFKQGEDKVEKYIPIDLADIYNRLLRTHKSHTGWLNKKAPLRQQNTGQSRSIQDIEKIVKHYFPKEKIQVRENLKHLRDELGIPLEWCSYVKKQVHKGYSNKSEYEIIKKALGKNNLKYNDPS